MPQLLVKSLIATYKLMYVPKAFLSLMRTDLLRQGDSIKAYTTQGGMDGAISNAP